VCDGIPLAISGIFSISASGEWLDVEGISRGGGTSVRVARYREVGVPDGLSPDVARSIQANALARRSTRAAFGAPVHLDDVVDAARLVQADVVAAWIRERAQQVSLTESDLASLDQSGLPPQVTDALFAVADSAATLSRAPDDPASYDDRSASEGVVAVCGRAGAACGAHGRGGTRQGPRDNPSQPGASSGDPRYAPSTPDRPSSGGTVRLGRP
jgi:hypothetical protein